ncbi:Acyl-CoA synthetases (AMP-forming)/AMP-acid ligases II [Butyrivibrio fibrisolvens 16/4]|nr:Acyl-CoA synthetases (AMP-forming)/AMP-acid ligases II [Butyrivibrio fibrisolvens 16/4]
MVRFIENGKNYGGQTAYRVLDGENTFDISFERFFQEAEICAYNLSQKMGDVKGKRIGILCNSTYEYVALVTAIVFSRGIAVPLNIRESIDTLNYEIENAELACVITDNDMLASLSTKIELLSLTDFLKDNGGKIELKDFAEDEKIKLLL